jgi:hypothetical protein
LLFRGLLVDDLQVRGFAAQPGAVIHDFAIDLAGCEVDETQDFPQSRGSAYLPRAKNIPTGASGFYITRTGFEQVTQVTTGQEARGKGLKTTRNDRPTRCREKKAGPKNASTPPRDSYFGRTA